MGLQIGQEEGGVEGVWANVVPGTRHRYTFWLDSEEPLTEDGEALARIKVARSNNRDARKYLRNKIDKYRRVVSRDGVPTHIAERLARGQVAETILLDWEGVALPDGSTPPYTPEKGVEAFEADDDFFELVQRVADEYEALRNERLAEDADTLGNGSGGKSETDP